MKTEMQPELFTSDHTIGVETGALFSTCKNYRFTLWRLWDRSKPLVMFIGLNPSTANENSDDPTIKSVIRISKYNGYGGFYMMNCFPFITAYPEELLDFLYSPFHDCEEEENLNHLEEVSKQCSDVVFAWGNFKIVRESGRNRQLSKMFPAAKAIGLNKNGSPKHPLFQKGSSNLIHYCNPLHTEG